MEMKKLVLAAVATALMLASRPAEAGGNCGRGSTTCPGWISAIGYTFGAAIVGGYAAGTGYFIYRDMTDTTQSLEYGGAEAGINGALAALWIAGTVDAAGRKANGEMTAYAGLAAIHTALAAHGAYRIYERRADFGPINAPSKELLTWVGGFALGGNALLWSAGLGGDHGRTYGIVEATVNGTLAVGLGALAVHQARDRDVPRAFLFGGLAALSGAFVVHGIRTAVKPYEPPGFDFLGTNVMPTIVDDGIETAPGLGMSGSW
jgi:hypothetical protein